MAGGLVGVLREDVPAPEDQIVQVCEGDNLFDEGKSWVRPFAQTHPLHLREGAVWLGNSFIDQMDSGDQRRRYRPQPREQYPQRTGGRFNHPNQFRIKRTFFAHTVTLSLCEVHSNMKKKSGEPIAARTKNHRAFPRADRMTTR